MDSTIMLVGVVVCVILIIFLIIRINNTGGVTQEQSVNGKRFGTKALVEITDDLYYDVNTLNVYYWNGHIYDTCATVPTAYYAPNGLQYKYDPDTHSFIEPDIS